MRTVTKFLAGAAMAVGLAGAASAHSSTLFFNFPGPTGIMATDTSYSATFNANAGPGAVAFTLDGYLSLDGQNFFEDDFTLRVNGSPVAQATFNLGGGGNDVVYFAPIGSFIFNISGNGNTATFTGGHVLFGVPATFTQGVNTVTWEYDSLPGPNHAGFQGTGDEGWGLSLISIGGANGVPEPLTWALMIMGFGAAGVMLRRARSLASVA